MPVWVKALSDVLKCRVHLWSLNITLQSHRFGTIIHKTFVAKEEEGRGGEGRKGEGGGGGGRREHLKCYGVRTSPGSLLLPTQILLGIIYFKNRAPKHLTDKVFKSRDHHQKSINAWGNKPPWVRDDETTNYRISQPKSLLAFRVSATEHENIWINVWIIKRWFWSYNKEINYYYNID